MCGNAEESAVSGLDILHGRHVTARVWRVACEEDEVHVRRSLCHEGRSRVHCLWTRTAAEVTVVKVAVPRARRATALIREVDVDIRP